MKSKPIVVAVSPKAGFWMKFENEVFEWKKAVENYNNGLGTFVQKKTSRINRKETYQLEYQHFAEPQKPPWSKLESS